MAMVHCRGCGEMIHESATTCPKCGAPQGAVGSRSSSDEPLPDGIKGFSWGALLFNWLWGVCNGTWISLLALIPYVGFIMAIVLGFKGREWAWRNKKWESVEHFQRVQRLWSIWAVSICLGSIAIGILAAVAIPAYQAYTERASRAAAAERAVPAPVERAPAPVARTVPPPPPVATAPEPVAPAPVPVAVAPEPPAAAPTPAVQERAPTPVAFVPPAPPPVADTLVAEGRACADTIACVKVMLRAAVPRRPEVLSAAAASLSGLNTSEPGDRKSSRALNTQGLSKYAEKDYVGAANLFANAAGINPRDAEIQSNLGLALLRAGQPDKAVASLMTSLQIDPQRSSAWAPMAEALSQLNLSDAAYASLLLTYEYSGNRQKTLEFFRARGASEDAPGAMRDLYAKALQTVEAGY